MECFWKSLLDYLNIFDLIVNLYLTALYDGIKLLHSVERKGEFLLKVLAGTNGADILSLEDSSSDFTFHHLLLFLMPITFFVLTIRIDF
jgi:hypothetical protein